MKNNLNDLIFQAKRNNTQAMMEIIQRFEPKIKKSLHQTSFQNRDDLKQDLIVKFIEVVHNWDIEKGEMSL
ncbi:MULTISPECIES: helix-turn-helix domain-containing protein [Paenibacillus]|uniref:helix-turn-helix domain-containing protein n=1 Tax=Paenibacillus TaxID=44249 RepID=UPI000B8860BB|nr:helix-turn-helix domain-containing protein [Paenibacillus amylolyticus]